MGEPVIYVDSNGVTRVTTDDEFRHRAANEALDRVDAAFRFQSEFGYVPKRMREDLDSDLAEADGWLTSSERAEGKLYANYTTPPIMERPRYSPPTPDPEAEQRRAQQIQDTTNRMTAQLDDLDEDEDEENRADPTENSVAAEETVSRPPAAEIDSQEPERKVLNATDVSYEWDQQGHMWKAQARGWARWGKSRGDARLHLEKALFA